jgi:hypothetical protein
MPYAVGEEAGICISILLIVILFLGVYITFK